MLEVTSSKQEMILGIDFTDVYKNSDLYRSVESIEKKKALIKELSSPHQGSRDLCFPSQYTQSFHSQFVICLWKQRASYWRNTSYTAVRFLFTTFTALMFETIFCDLGTKRRTRQDLFNSMGSMYSAVMFVGLQNAATVQPVVAVERTVFYRERAAGMYSSFAHAIAQVLVEVPYIFLQTVLYGVYSMIGFEWSVAKFFWYLFFMFTTLLYYTFFGMMTVALTPNLSIAAILAG